MKHWTIAALFLCAFFAGQLAQAASPALTFLPIVAQDAAAQFEPTITTMDGGDNTYISTARSPAGCTFVAYIDRDSGNRLVVKQDAGDHLIDVHLPIPLQAALATAGREIAAASPGFTAPGDKQADGALVIYASTMELWYTSRGEDDASGPFRLRRLRMPLPACV